MILLAIFALDRVDFIKIDVEGFEQDVLQGMPVTVNRFAPFIFIEFNSFALTQFRNVSPRSVLEYLRYHFGP